MNLKFFNKEKHTRGFTLLELLVVIGIIVIITSMGMSSYSTAQKKARDAQRKSDIRAISNALEQYYSICGYKYPTPGAGNVFTNISCSNPSETILNPVPTDPKTGDGYTCSSCTTSSYNICATLELGGNFCVKNQQ